MHNGADEAVDEGWGKIVSEIDLEERYAPALEGLEEFSHAVIVFDMHRFRFKQGDDLRRRPRRRDDMPLMGLFAQRAKHRPNPLGITVVEVVSVKGAVLTVRGLDAVNGTPDIKPYFPQFDRVESPIVPEWVPRLMQGYF